MTVWKIAESGPGFNAMSDDLASNSTHKYSSVTPCFACLFSIGDLFRFGKMKWKLDMLNKLHEVVT